MARFLEMIVVNLAASEAAIKLKLSLKKVVHEANSSGI
jgi:hypothetical protein